MKRKTTAAVLVAALLGPGLTPASLRAADEWRIGAAVRIGQDLFRVAYHADHGGPYYRVDRRIQVPGRACSRFCRRQGRSYYHHSSCPLLREQNRRYRAQPIPFPSRYRPPGISYAGPPALHPYPRPPLWRQPRPYRDYGRADRYRQPRPCPMAYPYPGGPYPRRCY